MNFLMAVHQLWAPHNLGVQNKVYYKIKQRFYKYVNLTLEFKKMKFLNRPKIE